MAGRRAPLATRCGYGCLDDCGTRGAHYARRHAEPRVRECGGGGGGVPPSGDPVGRRRAAVEQDRGRHGRRQCADDALCAHCHAVDPCLYKVRACMSFGTVYGNGDEYGKTVCYSLCELVAAYRGEEEC